MWHANESSLLNGQAMSAEYRSTFASPSLVMVTYPYAWKILVGVDWLIDWLSFTPHRQCLCLLTEENGSKNHNQTNKQINHYHCMNSKTSTMITSDRLINWLIDWLIGWLIENCFTSSQIYFIHTETSPLKIHMFKSSQIYAFALPLCRGINRDTPTVTSALSFRVLLRTTRT